MRLRQFTISILIGLAILAAMATAAATAAQSQAQLVPFWGHTAGEVYYGNPGACTTQPLQTLSTSQGEVTHLGKSTLTTAHCASRDGSLALGGQATFTAANGDQIFATYTAHVVSFSPPLLVEQGEFTITGGTGRFERASGLVPFTVYVKVISPPTADAKWPIELVFAGAMSY